MMETIRSPPASVSSTSELTAPFVSLVTFPRKAFLALVLMDALFSCQQINHQSESPTLLLSPSAVLSSAVSVRDLPGVGNQNTNPALYSPTCIEAGTSDSSS